MSSSPAPLTWLQAAEYVLREEGPEMHIKDLTARILELGIVKSNCATSLETLLYRQTSGGIQGKGVNVRIVTGPTKFIRVQGKHGWFGLKPSVLLEESGFLNMSLESTETVLTEENSGSEQELEVELRLPYPTQQQQQPKRRSSPHSSDDENNPFFMMSSEEDSSEEEDDLGDSGGAGTSGDDDLIEDENLYRKRCVFLKRLAKSIVFENFALANQLLATEEAVKKAEAERRFLFKKLLMFEHSGVAKRSVAGILPSSMSSTNQRPASLHASSQLTDVSCSNHRMQTGHERPCTLNEEPPVNNKRSSAHLGWQTRRLKRLKEAESEGKKIGGGVRGGRAVGRGDRGKGGKDSVSSDGGDKGGVDECVVTLSTSKDQNKLLMSDSSENSMEEWNEDSDDDNDIGQAYMPISSSSFHPRHQQDGGSLKNSTRLDAASKSRLDEEVEDDGEEELELAMRSGKVRRLHPISLNKDGTPVFPIVIGGLKVNDLGTILCDREAYHTERYLLPVGFESSRMYPSMIDPTQRCSYTCRILDGGDTPIFEMVAEDDDMNPPIRASSSTACQSIVLKNINKARDKQATNSGSGPEFFGYSNPTILNLLQKMPDAKKCHKYKFVRFAEPSRRGGRRKVASGGSCDIRKINLKSKTLMKKTKKKVPAKKTIQSKPLYASSAYKGPRNDSNSAAIAPVGMKDSSDSSSSELSSATDNELVIDS